MDEEQKLLTKEFQPSSQEQLEEVLHGDPEMLMFFYQWLKHGCNGAAAYRAMRPNVTEESSRVLASRKLQKLTKVSPVAILAAFGMDISDYMKLLHEGLSATMLNPKTEQQEPDYRVRRAFHQALGKILGLE